MTTLTKSRIQERKLEQSFLHDLILVHFHLLYIPWPSSASPLRVALNPDSQFTLTNPPRK